MLVLIACEYSGVTRRAFRERGHDAWSCDLLPSEDESPYHYQCNVLEILDKNWDLMIAHPPCTYLAVSGIHWNNRIPGRKEKSEQALEFVRTLLDAPIPKIALENPVGIISTHIRKPDQKIQPWEYGHSESKLTCLWLKNLPLLKPTNILTKPEKGYWDNQTPSGQNKLGPSEDRWKKRSLTYTGWGAAFAEQWGV